MKITCVAGSARTSGSCAYIVDTFIKGVKENNDDIEIIKYNISTSKINFCLGCKECYKNGVCVQNDDVQIIADDILSSDIVLIATPVLLGRRSGSAQNLFDRNTPFGNTNEKRVKFSKNGAKGIGIAIRAGKNEKENTLILDYIDHYYGHLDIAPACRISICETDSLSDLKKKHIDKINQVYDIGKNIKCL